MLPKFTKAQQEARSLTHEELETIATRVNEVYDFLVDQTETGQTGKQRFLLHKALEAFEYVKNGEELSLDDWFEYTG
jgi:hypothetical protein